MNINNANTMLIHKISCKMTMLVSWLGWMKSSCKLHFYAITITTWCYIIFLQLQFYATYPRRLGPQQVTCDNYEKKLIVNPINYLQKNYNFFSICEYHVFQCAHCEICD
jgi:hypothetical protein